MGSEEEAHSTPQLDAWEGVWRADALAGSTVVKRLGGLNKAKNEEGAFDRWLWRVKRICLNLLPGAPCVLCVKSLVFREAE